MVQAAVVSDCSASGAAAGGRAEPASRDAALTAPVFLLRPLPAGDRLVLDGAEGRHAATVRRLRAGERVDVTDGCGELAECVVAEAVRDRLELSVVRRVSVAPPRPRIVVVQALVKGERSELAVELLTEVGVDEIVPWTAARCVMRWVPERSGRRWQQAAAEAAKQARRVRWPLVCPVATTAQIASRLAGASDAYLLHEEASVPLPAALAGSQADGDREIVIVVGPEGGLIDAELDTLTAAGAQPVRLGPTVLRASTAGCAAAAVLLASTGRWDATGELSERNVDDQ
jgi:16S rRNA (uracil1498-N3)-methyltransferase